VDVAGGGRSLTLVDASLIGGMSGSPILTAHGTVVGVVSLGRGDVGTEREQPDDEFGLFGQPSLVCTPGRRGNCGQPAQVVAERLAVPAWNRQSFTRRRTVTSASVRRRQPTRNSWPPCRAWMVGCCSSVPSLERWATLLKAQQRAWDTYLRRLARQGARETATRR